MPPRTLLAGCALAATALLSSTPALPAGDPGSTGASAGAQTSKDSSGSGNVRERRGGSAPGERADDAVSANPEARPSDKPAEAKRLIENPEKPDVARNRPEGTRPEPGAAGSGPEPGPSIRDRSGEVR